MSGQMRGQLRGRGQRLTAGGWRQTSAPMEPAGSVSGSSAFTGSPCWTDRAHASRTASWTRFVRSYIWHESTSTKQGHSRFWACELKAGVLSIRRGTPEPTHLFLNWGSYLGCFPGKLTAAREIQRRSRRPHGSKAPPYWTLGRQATKQASGK